MKCTCTIIYICICSGSQQCENADGSHPHYFVDIIEKEYSNKNVRFEIYIEIYIQNQ